MHIIYKGFIALILAATFLTSGCSEKTDSGHEGHMAEGHDQHKSEAKVTGKKTAQIFEGGRIVMFEETPPSINLLNQDGKRVTNEDLKGKVTLINFIYTRCDESCPIMVHKFMDIEKEMKAELTEGKLQLLSITMDPEHDSPEILKKYAGKIEADTSYWSFLTEKKDIVDKVLKGFNFFYQKNEDGTFGHGNTIVMIDRNGVWKYNFNVLTVPVDILLERLKKEF
ncbi:MAG: SCO family protein [bacterium]|nr:SCO family protein [bacterium]